ncbi:MAG: hypothetical protein IKT03_06360, partial [Muribaculaceae bacterium]|nr:hypothetical protein [Muribaculaceae bacterium]
MTENYHKHINSFTRAALLAIMLLTQSLIASAFDMSHYCDTSRLATGKWVKIAVKESGIYQITASDASKWGLGDLSRVKVFGYGGAQINDTLKASIPDDLPQVPVVRVGDRILFYSQGPTQWKWSGLYSMYVQSQHPYATQGYYFVTDDSSYNDLTPTASSITASGTMVNKFTERMFHEEELINPGVTGRNLLGEDFTGNNSQSFKFTLDGLVDGSTVKVLTRFGAKTLNAASSVSFKYNGNNLEGTHRIEPVSSKDPNHYHYNVA